MATISTATKGTHTIFPRLSFFKGMTRAIDFGQRLSRYRRTMRAPSYDYDALAADWRAVEADFRQALAQKQRPR